MRTNRTLAERRLISRVDREVFQYEIVRFHLEDLNALGERRRAGRSLSRSADGNRVMAITRAARWDREGFLTAIRRFVDEGRGQHEDAFGPVLLLRALGADDDPFVTAVDPAVREQVSSALSDAGVTEAAHDVGPAAVRRRRQD
jgi:hypothetical protein